MLTRVYIDNYRCFSNFEYRPDRKQLIMGPNGSGKSSLVDALLLVRQFANDKPLPDNLHLRTTRWMRKSQQTFEIEARIDGGTYIYRLLAEVSSSTQRSHLISESLHIDGRPRFEFQNDMVQVTPEGGGMPMVYPFESRDRSAMATVPAPPGTQLGRFRAWIGQLVCFRLNPFKMTAYSEQEDASPNVDLSNVGPWYRRLLQSEPRESESLRNDLRRTIDGFDILRLAPGMKEGAKILMADFRADDNSLYSVNLAEFSDGQRCLISLYMILHFVVSKGGTVVIDEPDNFISLRELQPWLIALDDAVDDGKGQVVLISHHPEFINQWAPDYGVVFHREDGGHVRLNRFAPQATDALSPAELVARGWENE